MRTYGASTPKGAEMLSRSTAEAITLSQQGISFFSARPLVPSAMPSGMRTPARPVQLKTLVLSPQ
jgi:hypothetical protein